MLSTAGKDWAPLKVIDTISDIVWEDKGTIGGLKVKRLTDDQYYYTQEHGCCDCQESFSWGLDDSHNSSGCQHFNS
jgi:hypothetical protein